MGIIISKTSEAAFARATFRLAKSDIRSSYKDYLALEILQEPNSMANFILLELLTADDLCQLFEQIKYSITVQPHAETLAPEIFMTEYRQTLANQTIDKHLSTIHIFRDIAADPTSATSKALAEYGISVEMIDRTIEKFTDIEVGFQSPIQSPYQTPENTVSEIISA